MSNKEEKLEQERVFPIFNSSGYPTHKSHLNTNDCIGISKRFYAACAAMQGLIAGCDVNGGGFYAEWTAKAAFNMADELLEQENEE